ncbi:MAG: DNA polymerase III subunit beta [Parcubacteria group bacterium]
MKFTVLKNNLKNSLDAVSRIAGENTALPILKNVLVKAEGGKIDIIATDLETAIIKTVAGKIMEDGQITIPFVVFNNVINNIQSERIDIENKGLNIQIKTDSYEAKIQGMNYEEFPIIPRVERKDEFIEIKGEVLKESINAVISAAQISELRPEISGILLDVDGETIKFVATDSFRLAEKTLYSSDFVNNFERGFKIIIPLKPAQEIVRIITDKETIRIYSDESQLMVKDDDITFITRLIDGKFPEYTPIIPKNTSTNIEVNRAELTGALKLVSSFSPKNNEVIFRIVPDQKLLEIYSADSLLGENKYLIPAKITGEPLNISFNWRFIMDGLKNITSETVNMGFQGDVKPSVIKWQKDNPYTYIVMPIKD